MASRLDLIIRIAAQTAGAVGNVGNATSAFGRLQSRVKALAVPAAAAIGAVVAIGKAAADSASRQQQAMGSLESVYGDQAATVEKWASAAAKSVGLAKSEYAELASVMGAQLKNMGLATDDAAGSTNKLISLGADLSAAFGGSSKQAVEALGSALRGEADPAERYGLSLNQTTINAHLAAKGQDKLTGAALKAARANAIVELATKQAGGAVGQFARESDTAAGSAQIAAAQFEDAKASLGQALLPVVKTVSSWVAKLSAFLQANAGTVRIVAAVLVGLAGAVLAANGAIKIFHGMQLLWTQATKIATAVQTGFNAVMSANPILKVALVIGVLVAAVIYLWNNCEAFRNAIIAIWSAIQAAFQAAITFVSGLISGLVAGLSAAWSAITAAAGAAWRFVSNLITGVWRGIVSITTGIWTGIRSFLGSIWAGIQAVAGAAWRTVQRFIVTPLQAAYSWVTGTFGRIGGWFAGAWRTIQAGARSGWMLIKGYIIDPLTAAYSWVTGTFGKIGGFFSDLWSGIVGTMKRIFGGVSEFVSGVFGKLVGIIAAPINGIIRFINDTVIWGINKLIDGVNLLPFVDIPHVSPIPLLGSLTPDVDWHGGLATAAGNGQTINITVTGAVDADSTARQIKGLLTGRDRRIGPLAIGGAL